MSHNRPGVGILISDHTDRDPYFEVIRLAGAEPKELPEIPAVGALQGLAGVLVTGVGPQGRDVDPRFYREDPSSTQNTDPTADAYALAWLGMFHTYQVPVAGTCLGHQLEVVRRKGQLKSGIQGHAASAPGEETTRTRVRIEPGSLLYEVAGPETDVVCMHSQGAIVPPIPSGLYVVAHSIADNEIHAVETEDRWSFHGNQFHPDKDLDFGKEYYNAMIFHRWLRRQS